MLRRLVPLLAILPGLALAQAPSDPGALRVAKPAERESKLAAARQSTPLPPWPQSDDQSACRLTCADHSYLCRATDHPDDCGRVWAECVAICNASNLDPGAPAPP